MGRINVLDQKTANAIKAGEVIERPVSVVKELVDNSIDACATSIKIEFEGGGISLIRVSDNGIGMDREDAVKCFLIHATSKLKTIEDLYSLSTQGFRGEALASIAACADVTLVTKQSDAATGTLIRYCEGVLAEEREVPADTGTVISVSGLFANIPARYKFLKKDSTEGMYICSLVEKLAVINPDISFKLVKDGKVILNTPGSGDMLDAIYSIYGKDITSGLVPLQYEYEGLKLTGFAGRPDNFRGNRQMQIIYVNDRCIRNASVTAAVDEAYRNSLMKNKFPICFLCIYVPSNEVDVNVHPQKAEVKFTNEADVFRLVFHGIKEALFSEKKEAPEIVSEAAEKRSIPVGRQLSYDVKSLPDKERERPVNTAESKAALDLMSILAEFKPDIHQIESDDDSTGDNKDDFIKVDEYKVDEVPSEPKIIENDAPKSDVEELLSSRFVGFLFHTYILFEGDGCYFIVDQHAAHERVLYEKFMKRRKENDALKSDVQTLMVPQMIELSSADYSFVSDNISSFEENGFDIELMGERQIALRAIPVADSHSVRLKSMEKPSVIFSQILSDLKRETPKKSDIWYSLIQTTACKAAIKAHDVITQEEAEELVRMLSKLEDPYHCAHGRPTFKKIFETDLEKDFKRIV